MTGDKRWAFVFLRLGPQTNSAGIIPIPGTAILAIDRSSLFFGRQEFLVDFGYYYVIWVYHFCHVDCGYFR